MASWILVPCLRSLQNEFNELAPARDRASDGAIGNAPHAAGTSDHNPDETGRTPTKDADSINEVHAIDTDADLRKPGWTMQRAVNIIVGRHRRGEDDRLQNVIWNRRIASRSWGWTWQDYTGPSPHTEHAHFSARYTTAQEQDTRPWGLLEDDQEDDMNKTDFFAWMDEWASSKTGQERLAVAVWNFDPGVDGQGEIRPGGVKNYGATGPSNPTVAPAWSLGRAQVAANLGAILRTKVDQVLVQMKVLTGKDYADEDKIVAGVLEGLDPKVIAAAIPKALAQQVLDALGEQLRRPPA